jgi:isopentenyl-diphosphate Delta-isomerase
MKNDEQNSLIQLVDDDPNAVNRKKDHIELAFKSQVPVHELDNRFYYEPILVAHPTANGLTPFRFLEKTMNAPLWVSSMTGGTALANTINHNLAKACSDFGMGMGLGSCRQLLYSDEYLKDFDVRDAIGDQPLYANLGIAQLEQLIDQKEFFIITNLIKKLQADGLIVHINPMQEWLQPEGDRFKYSPLQTIERLLDHLDIKIIVKEVGQGMGYGSLKALFQLPIEAIDFAASGGTNFALLELLRNSKMMQETYGCLAKIGHSAEDMVDITNQVLNELGDKALCKQVIISGGIGSFLDGYYLINKLQTNCIYGQASAFLKHAQGDYESLYQYVETQIKGLEVANAFLRVRA